MTRDYLDVADTYIKTARRRKWAFFSYASLVAVVLAAVIAFSYWQVDRSDKRFAALQQQIESQLDSIKVFQTQMTDFYGQLGSAMSRLDSAQWRLEQISSSDLSMLNNAVSDHETRLSMIRDTISMIRQRYGTSSEKLASQAEKIERLFALTESLDNTIANVSDSLIRLSEITGAIQRLRPRIEEQLVGAQKARETIASLTQRLAEIEKRTLPIAMDSTR